MRPHLSHRPPRPQVRSSPPTGVVSRAMWLARWLLVLLLVWDQVGSPLHQHHHDSGIDGSWLTASHDDGSASTPHLEGVDGGPSFAHAVTTVQPPTKFDSPVADSAATPLPLYAFVELVNFALAKEPLPRPDRHPPDYSSYRSLPPASRAPPLHA